MTTPTEAALAAARAVVKASSGTRLPMDTGRDTPAEELWGALLNLRAALAALDAGAGEPPEDAACRHHGMGQMSGLTTAIKFAEKWAAQYPVDVFPPDGTSIEARAAHHARRVAGFIAQDCRDLIARCSGPAPSAAPTTEGIRLNPRS